MNVDKSGTAREHLKHFPCNGNMPLQFERYLTIVPPECNGDFNDEDLRVQLPQQSSPQIEASCSGRAGTIGLRISL